jgi:hypothetical protein
MVARRSRELRSPACLWDIGRSCTAGQARLQGQDASQLRLNQPVDLREMRLRWMRAAEEALALIERLPVTERGCLYLNATGKPVCPDPASPEFPKLTRHYGSVKGAWPRIVGE